MDKLLRLSLVFSFSADIGGRAVEKLVEVYWQSKGLVSSQKPKVQKFLKVIRYSVDVTERTQMARFEIVTLDRRYRQ
ncbi:hypothetical protein GLN3_09150 [Geobacillus lituanicus]|nr:hypothetical protein GLN3_09150 [Geobacillus lituanicus]